MKTAYFDCFSGISGDMILAALLDAGLDEASFRAELAKLPDIEFDLKISKVIKHGITASDVDVIIFEDHHHRRLKDIEDIINVSELSDSVKSGAIGVFRKLADAEAKVHGTTPDDVHFHEVGAVDAIVDITGSIIGLEMLGIKKVYASPLPMGHGFVKAAHGIIPIPAPATVELLTGIPVYSTGIESELVTPTGAALISSIASGFGDIPSMTLQKTGYGAGKKDFGIPNVLRVLISESVEKTLSIPSHKVSILETNIDDMNPEFYDSLFEKLFKAGALDVYISPVQMKKNRPASLLCAICPPDKVDIAAEIILRNTTSFGVRISSAERRCLDRAWETVSTAYGDIRIKVGMLNGETITESPEYEDCKAAAQSNDIPLKKVYEAALQTYSNKSTSKKTELKS
ncbi:MAG: nickel pincer cofactor biosynthesis protein LarC [Armatimonadota bacterium]